MVKNKEVECEECGGTGEGECPTCGCTCSYECDECDGTGKIDVEDNVKG